MSRPTAWAALCGPGAQVTVGERTLQLRRDRGRWSATAADLDALLAAPLEALRRVVGVEAWWDGRRARLLAAAIAELGVAGTHPLLAATSSRALALSWQHGRGLASDHALASAHVGAAVALRRAESAHRAINRSLLLLDEPDLDRELMAELLDRPALTARLRQQVGLGLFASGPDPAVAASEAARASQQRRRDIALSAVLDEVFLSWLGGRDRDGVLSGELRLDR
jgi:hypothetical protein